ncbi:MAG TPA: serine hydrolase domain-containing protein [Tepidisphaeraceae bacterium]|nr:serine hydrolase domain-containing protein [Tepidisphaeraceae bacterium]
MRTYCVLVLVVGLACTFARADAPQPSAKFDPARLARVGDAMRQMEAAGQIAGAVTLIETREGIVQIKATGKSNLANDQPMKADAIFWIASMTKPVTATAILMLQDDGKLSVDDPVSKYLPEFASLKTPSGKAANLTLKQLLSHTSGMVLEAPLPQRLQCHTLADLIPIYAGSPMRFEPGTKWEYCQSGINTLGRIVEVVSGKTFGDFCHQRIFTPLGMNDSTFYPTDQQAARLATGYKRVGGKLVPNPFTFVGDRPITSREHYPAPNAGLFTTAADYGRLCRMLLNEGSLDGRQFLRPEAVHQMRTIQTGDLKAGFSPGCGWGLGVCVIRDPQGITAMLSPGTFGHGGAWGTEAWIDPVKGFACVLMIQRTDFPSSAACPVREMFQQAAVDAIVP